MTNSCWLTVATGHLCLCLLSITAFSTAFAKDLQYNQDIRPILSDKCFYCHGPDEEDRQADLRLDLEESAKEAAIVPGKPGESELIARILSADPDTKMPPPDSRKSLSEDEIARIQQWVEQGAVYQPYWAYVPPLLHAVPDVKSNWPRNEIDAFILNRIQEESLQPAEATDPVTLIRRLSFDLIGLPPSIEEVDAFVADHSEEKYEALVDRLLDSPRYGERMAMYWLDLVRYADTVGYHGDQDHHISPYRDWVIDAFNANLPFDQMTREQLAGDLLPDATLQQKIATGYNRLLQTTHEGGLQPKEYLAIYAADRVRNVSAVWMGATVGCAQCHNHKFDPYTAKDFYSLAAFFADVDEAQHFKSGSNALPTNRPPEILVPTEEQTTQLESVQTKLKALEADVSKPGVDQDKLKELLKEAKNEQAALQKQIRKTMVTVSIKPREMRLLPRGNWLDETGPIVQPAVPEFMGRLNAEGRATRLDLANWLCDLEHGTGGLTARVQVNRLWYLMLGTGLARDLDDFGGQGEAPVHPELLDHLAIEFIKSGWDIKVMLKHIVMSSTYRQSSGGSPEMFKRDPYNQLFARQSSYRLPAEMVRDTALSISELLVLDYGGASVKPYQPAGYYRHLNFPTREYEAHTDARQWRRGVYMHWQRQFLHPMLKSLDAPSREECTAERPRSNTPLAALVLLNDPTFVEAARSFAERILKEGGSEDTVRLQFAFRSGVGRHPDQAELELLQQLLVSSRESQAANEISTLEILKVGQSKPDSTLNQIELSLWTTIARAILNLNETFSRN